MLNLENIIKKTLVVGTLFAATVACIEGTNITIHEPPTQTVYLTEEPTEPYKEDIIRIATFNIQVFGNSKSSNPDVMDYLAQIACEFDIMAVQEIRSVNDHEKIVADYLELINETCEEPRDAIINENPLGRSSSKENYVFVFNTSTIDFIENSDYVYTDTDDVFEREPYIAQFSAGSFDFVIINNHIKPDDAYDEIAHLNQVYNDAQLRFPEEFDYIILGDLNADCTYLNEGEWNEILEASDFTSLIPNNADTTVKSTDCAYDRFLVSPGIQEDYTGNWKVYRYDLAFNLDQEFSEDISDHFPAWTEFYTDKDTD